MVYRTVLRAVVHADYGKGRGETGDKIWFGLVWFGLLRIYVALAVFQPYRDLEAGDNQSLKIQVARRGIEPRTSCSASQELNHSATAAPRQGIREDRCLPPVRLPLIYKMFLPSPGQGGGRVWDIAASNYKLVSTTKSHVTKNKYSMITVSMSKETRLSQLFYMVIINQELTFFYYFFSRMMSLSGL